MKSIRLTYPDDFTIEAESTSLAVGYFDGVHKGHQKVIQTAIDVANDKGLKSAVMTFDPHPMSVLRDTQLEDFLLTDLNQKLSYFHELGVDYVYVVTFNKALAQLSPQNFVDKFFIDLKVKHVVAGFDFSFGHKGQGKIHNMDQYANQQLSYTVVDKVTFQQEKISSTRIRQCLNQGEMLLATELLGRPYSINGRVIKGDQRGRTIGYPTANMKIHNELKVPKVGVYAIKATVSEKTYFGMANIGYNPTFTDQHKKPIVEVHLFNFNKDIYDETINVEFHKYIRDELKFNHVNDLIAKMNEDEAFTKNFFHIQ